MKNKNKKNTKTTKRIIILAIASLAILTLLFLTASKSEYCQCQYTTECYYRDGIGMRYWQCTGACIGYSQWKTDFRCALQTQNTE